MFCSLNINRIVHFNRMIPSCWCVCVICSMMINCHIRWSRNRYRIFLFRSSLVYCILLIKQNPLWPSCVISLLFRRNQVMFVEGSQVLKALHMRCDSLQVSHRKRASLNISINSGLILQNTLRCYHVHV